MSNNLQSPRRTTVSSMLFAALPEELQAHLLQHAHLFHAKSGQIIQQKGDRAQGFWLIKSGSIAVGQFLEKGEFRAAAVLGAGDSWGELAIFANVPRGVDAIARLPSELYYFPSNLLDETLFNNPAAMRNLLGALSANFLGMIDIVAHTGSGTSQSRLAGLLVNLAHKVKSENGSNNMDDDSLQDQSDLMAMRPASLAIGVSQQELAELLGLSRMTINSTLGTFENEGMIKRQYGRIEMCDLAALAQLATQV